MKRWQVGRLQQSCQGNHQKQEISGRWAASRWHRRVDGGGLRSLVRKKKEKISNGPRDQKSMGIAWGHQLSIGSEWGSTGSDLQCMDGIEEKEDRTVTQCRRKQRKGREGGWNLEGWDYPQWHRLPVSGLGGVTDSSVVGFGGSAAADASGPGAGPEPVTGDLETPRDHQAWGSSWGFQFANFNMVSCQSEEQKPFTREESRTLRVASIIAHAKLSVQPASTQYWSAHRGAFVALLTGCNQQIKV